MSRDGGDRFVGGIFIHKTAAANGSCQELILIGRAVAIDRSTAQRRAALSASVWPLHNGIDVPSRTSKLRTAGSPQTIRRPRHHCTTPIDSTLTAVPSNVTAARARRDANVIARAPHVALGLSLLANHVTPHSSSVGTIHLACFGPSVHVAWSPYGIGIAHTLPLLAVHLLHRRPRSGETTHPPAAPATQQPAHLACARSRRRRVEHEPPPYSTTPTAHHHLAQASPSPQPLSPSPCRGVRRRARRCCCVSSACPACTLTSTFAPS